MDTAPAFPTLSITRHPLIQHKLTILRDRRTPTKIFKELVDEIAMLMAYEATSGLQLEAVPVETPLEPATGWQVSGKKLTLVPILRAGLGMVEGILRLVPSARVGHIGLYRDHDTLEPVDYYFKVPSDAAERDFFVLDPMLATGGSAAATSRCRVMLRSGTSLSWTPCWLPAEARPPQWHHSSEQARRESGSSVSLLLLKECDASRRRTPTFRCTAPRSIASSTHTDTSCQAWGMPAIASSARARSPRPTKGKTIGLGNEKTR
jgi:uracil phosphoribosyltransferase